MLSKLVEMFSSGERLSCGSHLSLQVCEVEVPGNECFGLNEAH